MKNFIYMLCSLFLLSCENRNPEDKDKNMVKFYESRLFEKLQNTPEGERISLVFEVVELQVKNHHQSIFKEDSQVDFKIVGNTDFSKGLERIVVFYDNYGINKLELGGDFKKGQHWELTFNKNKELVKLKLLNSTSQTNCTPPTD